MSICLNQDQAMTILGIDTNDNNKIIVIRVNPTGNSDKDGNRYIDPKMLADGAYRVTVQTPTVPRDYFIMIEDGVIVTEGFNEGAAKSHLCRLGSEKYVAAKKGAVYTVQIEVKEAMDHGAALGLNRKLIVKVAQEALDAWNK